jgi:hypothetical protein
VIRDLIAAASEDPSEQMAEKSRFAEMGAAGQAEGGGRTAIPTCKAVLTQFERLEHFPDPPGLPKTPPRP